MHEDDHSALTIDLPDEAATLALGAAMAASVTPGLNIWLSGDLGTGKTTLVRGVLRALGHAASVKSPTYTLVELYVVSGLNLYHFDFYRFNSPDEFLEAGLDEYFGGNGICLCEWPEKAAPHLPAADLQVVLSAAGNGRSARIAASSPLGSQCLTNLRFRALVARPSKPPPPA